MDAVDMKFGRTPHGLEILRQAAGFENRTGPGVFVKAPFKADILWRFFEPIVRIKRSYMIILLVN